LAVEIDGDSHYTPEAVEYDRARTAYLGRFGIEVLRFTNLEVGENVEGVLMSIEAAVKRRRGTSPWPPPSGTAQEMGLGAGGVGVGEADFHAAG